MAKISWLVSPALWPAAVGSFFKNRVGPFLRRRWKWVLGAIVLVALTLFIINALTPDKVVSPVQPPAVKEEQKKAVEGVKDTKKVVDDAVEKTQDNQREHQDRINRVTNRPSKDIDDAIENWNEGT